MEQHCEYWGKGCKKAQCYSVTSSQNLLCISLSISILKKVRLEEGKMQRKQEPNINETMTQQIVTSSSVEKQT